MPPQPDNPFWLAYESAVKQALGVVDDQILFIRPFTHPWIETKTAISEEVINYLVYRLADTLLLATPGSPESYTKDLSM
jgi:hypothetical protein